MIDSAKNEYEAAVAQERNFGSDLERANVANVELDRKSGDYRILQRDLDSQRQIFQSLLDRQKQLSVVANSRANNVRLMDRAEPRRSPISPNPRRDWLTAILAGLTIAFGLAFGIEYLDDTIKTPEDITRRLKLPLLGLVPALRGGRVPVLTETVPHDFGEAFRSLRTSLVFTSGGESTRVMAVTSSQPLEGKTTTACNLALALALGGSRVLLIDADMRRPGPAQDDRPAERRRAVAPARRAGARARGDSAHERAEPVRDHRRPHAAEPVRAAGLGADEALHRQPGARAVRLGRHRHAAGAGRDRRGDHRAEGRRAWCSWSDPR